jgi:Protein of unknown function (DUF2795)
MTSQEAAEIQVLLEGVALPAKKRQLLAYARREDPDAVERLKAIPDREYRSLDEVGEALARVQPVTAEEAPTPREESDLPPGGPEYLNPHPQPGTVRNDAPPDNPPQKAIEQQSNTQKQQQERQKQLG